MKKHILLILLAGIIGLFVSCYTPSPLYGSWADNAGNKITFVQDGTFTAKIVDSEGNSEVVSGNYNVIDNVIVFNVTGDVVYSRNTEWDIRGAMLYLTWTTDKDPINLTLYHISR